MEDLGLAAVGRDDQDVDHPEDRAAAEAGALGLLEGGELGVNEGLGLLEVDQGPGAEPVVAGDLGELGGVQAAAGLELLEQHPGRAGVDQGQRDRGHRGRSDLQGGVAGVAVPGLVRVAITRMITLSMSG